MRPVLRIALALAAGAALTACSDQPSPSPTAPVVVRPNFAIEIVRPAWIPASCDITQLKSDARAYAKKANDLLVTITGDLGGEVSKNGFTRVATNKALDGLSRIAAIRGTGDQKSDVTALVFDRLVKGYLACTELEFTDGALEPTPPGGGGFGLALGSHWAFEVRGKNNDPNPNYNDPTTGVFERSKPAAATSTFWAVQPGIDDGGVPNWALSIGGSLSLDRVFIYGYQRSNQAIPAKYGSSFEHRTIPRISDPKFTMSAKIGLCGLLAIDGRRLNHDGTFLPLITSISCSPDPTPIATTSSIYALLNPNELAQRAVQYFVPQQLHAASFSVVGGRDNDFSPSAVYDLSQYQLSGLATIADGRTSLPLVLTNGSPITIKVTVPAEVVGDPPVNAAVGTPVVMSIVGNSSSIAYFTDGPTGPVTPTITRYVGADGIASFENVYLVKAGGYKLAFQVSLVNPETGAIDFAGAQVLISGPNQFSMQNK